MNKLRMLDCFCGLGGSSEGFHREGFDCTGIDVVNVGYPYRFILGDMSKLDGKAFRDYDVIWASPPCRDFCQLSDKQGTKTAWKIPKDPKRGMILVNASLTFIQKAKPKLWILENVNGLAKHMPFKPQAIGSLIKGGKKHVFYGNFPPFLIPQTSSIPLELINCPNRSWERAKIPLACSQAFARVCKEALEAKAEVLQQ